MNQSGVKETRKRAKQTHHKTHQKQKTIHNYAVCIIMKLFFLKVKLEKQQKMKGREEEEEAARSNINWVT